MAVRAPRRGSFSESLLRRTFESLGNRYFRYLWLGNLLGIGAMQMQFIARTILVDELTGSAFITSIVSVGFAPSMLLLSLFGGVAGDKLERRTLIQAAQASAGVLSLIIGILIVLGSIHWHYLLAASLIQGATFAFQMPARSAVIPELVGKARVSNAIALNSAGMSSMGLIAPATGAALYEVIGPAGVYFAVAGVYLVAVLFTSRIPRMQPAPATGRQPMIANVMAGLGYVKSNRLVLVLLLSGLAVALLALPFRMQLPVFARRLYGSDPSDIGLLAMAAAAGGLAGTLTLANIRQGSPRGFILLAGSILSGLALLIVAAFPWYAVGIAALVLVGLAESVRMTLGQSLTLEIADEHYRARVMSVFMMTYGLMPLGALPLGKAVDAFGARSSLLVDAGIVLLVTIGFMVGAKRLRRLR